MAFRFEYTKAVSMPKGEWASQEARLLGHLCEGTMSLGEPITIGLPDGPPFESTIARFMEELDNWLALPFYHTIRGETMGGDPFCVCIAGLPQDGILPGAGIAHGSLTNS